LCILHGFDIEKTAPQILFNTINGKKIKTKENPRELILNLCTGGDHILSLCNKCDATKPVTLLCMHVPNVQILPFELLLLNDAGR
jgi:hypothetical protein